MAFKQRISENSWLDEATKNKSREKVESIIHANDLCIPAIELHK